MMKVKDPVPLVLTFVWIGFVCAISFMEAWLKFQAPGVTLALGLSIGKLIFSALNKVEWVFSLALLLLYLPSKIRAGVFENAVVYALVAVFILLLQTLWLLPALTVRADLIIAGETAPASYLHFYFVGMEVIKVICLFVFGVKLFTKAT